MEINEKLFYFIHQTEMIYCVKETLISMNHIPTGYPKVRIQTAMNVPRKKKTNSLIGTFFTLSIA